MDTTRQSRSRKESRFLQIQARLSLPLDYSLSERASDEGACTNDPESYFSRLRRAEVGIHHHIAGPYLAAYAAEVAWREDHRRASNGEQYPIIVNGALAHPVSRQWKGYWHRGLTH